MHNPGIDLAKVFLLPALLPLALLVWGAAAPKDIADMRKALKADFEAAETNWADWKAIP